MLLSGGANCCEFLHPLASTNERLKSCDAQNAPGTVTRMGQDPPRYGKLDRSDRMQGGAWSRAYQGRSQGVRRPRDRARSRPSGRGAPRVDRQILAIILGDWAPVQSDRPSSRPRFGDQTMRFARMTPTTALPRIGSSTGLQGANVNVSSPRMTASFALGVATARS